MKDMNGGEPNIEDVMLKGFAELKIGEDNIVVEASEIKPPEDSAQTSHKIEYAKKIHAKEDRESFVVTAPIKDSSSLDKNSEVSPKPKQEILKESTTQPGDDFDVEW